MNDSERILELEKQLILLKKELVHKIEFVAILISCCIGIFFPTHLILFLVVMIICAGIIWEEAVDARILWKT